MATFPLAHRSFKGDSTAYNEGRRFRVFYDFSVSTLPVVVKFAITKNLDLTMASQTVYEGWLRYRVFIGGTEGGTFTPIAQSRVNNKIGIPVGIDSGMAVSAGGTLDLTGAAMTDIIYLKTIGSSNQSSTVSGEVSSVRGFPPTVAYVVIDQIPGGNNPPKGLLKYEWEVE